MTRRRVCALGMTLLLYLVAWHGDPTRVMAQSIVSGGTISEIRVDGTQRIEPESVRSYMRVNEGDPFDPVRLNNSLKNIFSTGLFADVTLRREGDVLVVTVVENPIINRIAFEGNDRLSDDELTAEVVLRPRLVFTRTRLQPDVQRILEIYRRSGRYAVTIEPKIIRLPQNRVDLVFEINEGPLTEIKSIHFIGNRAFSDSELRDEIATEEAAFWRIFTSTDTYDPDRLNFDQDLLRRFYLREGYAGFRASSVVAELLPDREGFIVTFTIEEGERHKFGRIDIETTLRNLDPDSLRDDLSTEEGDWFDDEAIEKSATKLAETVSNLGYAFVDVRPRSKRDLEGRLVHITYEIREGPKVYIERIDIQGNDRTLDRVIRREFRLIEGDAFNSAKLRRSRERIQRLGYFKRVEITNEPSSTAPDRTIVTVKVEEKSTGDLTFGAGFSSTVGPVGNLGVRERNLLGRGQDLRLNLSLAGEQSQIDLSFTEPYFLGRSLSAGVDVFHIESSLSQQGFDEQRTGGALRVGFSYTEHLRQVFRYKLEQDNISGVAPSASLLLKEEAGSFLESSLSQTLTYDTRDRRTGAREGALIGLNNEVAGLGGDVFFLKSILSAGYTIPFAENWTIGTRAKVGNIIGLNQDTRISDRFRIGGRNLRGFQFAGIGPRDRPTGDPLGAKQFYTGTLELGFPLGLPDELAIRGRIFADAGSAWGLDKTDADVQDEASLRASVGAGITWQSPLGPFVIDFGFALLKEPFDRTERLSISFGTQF